MKSVEKFIHEPKKFHRKKQEEIKKQIMSMNFHPLLISNNSDFEYSPHAHPETKLLAILEGSMTVLLEGDLNIDTRSGEQHVVECKKGDLIIIPGDMVHAAKVGKYGCKFFWSERLPI